jgi:glycosyltransferase involved in cell wall biosynthesis
MNHTQQERPSDSRAHIIFTYVGQLEYRGRLLKEISTLQEAGFHCEVIYGAWDANSFDQQKYNFPVHVIPVPNRWGGLMLYLLQLWFGIKVGRIIAASKATHVVGFSLQSLLAGALAKRRRPSLKLIFDSNELHLESMINPIKRMLWTPIQKFCVSHCDVMMHAEANRLTYFCAHYGPSACKHFVLENFPHYIPRDALGPRAPFPPVRVLYVGVLGADRYTRELIDIFRELAPEYTLDLVGPMSPAYAEELKHQIEVRPAPTVRLRPAIAYGDMSKLIAEYHVGIALYKNDNLTNYYCAPNKIYDCLMSGVPVIANDYPGPLQVLENGKVGACIKAVDVDSFRTALERIVSEQRWNNITDEVRRRYSWEAQRAGFIALFNSNAE